MEVYRVLKRNQMLTPPTAWLDEGIAFYTYP